MAILKNGVILRSDNISIEDFEPESGGYILDILLVENNKLILVKEILHNGLGYTFFDIERSIKLDPNRRAEFENGRIIENLLPGGLKAVMEICVDPSTGVETVIDKVFDGDTIVYQGHRERYPARSFEELYDKYLSQQELQTKEAESIVKLTEKFVSSSTEEQIGLLRGEFRNKWRANNELGFENPEFFLSKEVYGELKNVSGFFDALKNMLIAEGDLIGENAEVLYGNILQHYESIGS